MELSASIEDSKKIVDCFYDNKDIGIACYDGKTLSPFIISLYLMNYGQITKEQIKKIIQSKNINISMIIELVV